MIKQPLVTPDDAISFSALQTPSTQVPDNDSSFLSQYQSRNPQALEAATVYAADLYNATRPKMIVFDKDGTLGDCTGSLRRWVMHMASNVRTIIKVDQQREGECIIQELYNHLGWDVERDDVVPSAPVAAGTWDGIVSIVFEFLVSKQSKLNTYVTLDLVKQWHHELGNLHGQDAPVIDNLRSMILACQSLGYLVAICTSDDRPATDAAMKAWNIDDIVDASICGNEVAYGKPSPVPLYDLCSKVNQSLQNQNIFCSLEEILPQDCIMVGDTTADTGMSKAADVGFCIGVLTGSGTTEQLLDGGAHLIVPDVSHIPALLEVLQGMALDARSKYQK
ncbi:phosphatase/phosphohexomutase [Nitzschia inconspicua]|uniref:Phosphatase/phosphohexomutase n=1 Tax=Nitzschia inconspicua TaxID=303405 RepID=A0A9K3PFS5_9STRA|nr:phosphatase/phosphohexomutase [Nitzschia inconspicua]